MPPRFNIAILTRYPTPGAAKTRLIPALGAEGASRLQRRMAEHVARQCRMAAVLGHGRAEVRIDGASARDATAWLGLPAAPQGAGDLGAKLGRALDDGTRRAPVAIAIGSDCPSLDARDILELVEAARRERLAFVPAEDGGFCAIGVSADLRPRIADLMKDIDWGTGSVLQQSVSRAGLLGIAPAILGARFDVDRAEDVARWQELERSWYAPPSSLSVVIPTRNESQRIGELVTIAKREAAEVIVVDGRSDDETQARAADAGAVVAECEPMRGLQLNLGARTATGDALLFLHADAKPSPGFASTALQALADTDLLVGAYRFDLDDSSPSLRVIQAMTRARGSVLRMPYGDQGLFCRGVAWRALGGFPEWSALEDYEFVKRARRAGVVRVLDVGLTTSARTWREVGPWRWTAINLATALRHELGSDAEKLARWRASHTKR